MMVGLALMFGALLGPAWQGRVCDAYGDRLSRFDVAGARKAALAAAAHGGDVMANLSCALQLAMTPGERTEVADALVNAASRGTVARTDADVLAADVEWDRGLFERRPGSIDAARDAYRSAFQHGASHPLIVMVRARPELRTFTEAESWMAELELEEGVARREDRAHSATVAADALDPFLAFADSTIPRTFAFVGDLAKVAVSEAVDMARPQDSVVGALTVVFRACALLRRVRVFDDEATIASADAECGVLGERVHAAMGRLPVRPPPVFFATRSRNRTVDAFVDESYARALSIPAARDSAIRLHAANFVAAHVQGKCDLPGRLCEPLTFFPSGFAPSTLSTFVPAPLPP